MINQIAPLSRKTSKLVKVDKTLSQVHLIQDKLKGRTLDPAKPERGILWSPATPGPYVVPVLRWIE